jgi:hypothetical protein
MNFIPRGSTGNGEDYTAINFDDKSWYNEDYISFKRFFNPKIKDFLVNEKDRVIELETEWIYILFSGDKEVYKFRSYYKFDITGVDKPFEAEDLKNIISISHQHLQSSFEEKRKEHRIFKPVPALSDEARPKVVSLLSEELLHLQA